MQVTGAQATVAHWLSRGAVPGVPADWVLELPCAVSRTGIAKWQITKVLGMQGFAGDVPLGACKLSDEEKKNNILHEVNQISEVQVIQITHESEQEKTNASTKKVNDQLMDKEK